MLATAISHIDNLEFLSDVVPKTTTYKQYKEKKAKEAAQGGLEKGQRTLNGSTPAAGNANGAQEESAPQGEDSNQSPTVARVPVSVLIADRTVERDNDVEMQD